MNNPFTITDSHGSEWLSNGDGTYRDTSSEIRSLTKDQIVKEFGLMRSYRESVGEGYSVRIEHCVTCGYYLGVNYPSQTCDSCRKENN